ncbi:MAG: LysR family transcriptional regulator [Burkholderiaceae bacterium]|nr:MAG: LysR family transcriptional regulator [Burkholderiaceae bacterium]
MAFTSDNVQVFLAVLDQGSFSAAARALGRVPSAVSMAMAHLEAELALTLFERSGREPRPSAAARALEPQARQIELQLRALAAHALSLTQGLEERLTLAVAPELVPSHWSAALARLAAQYPLLDVQVLVAPQSDALQLLHSGRAQLALVFERPLLDGREGFQQVGRETLVAVAGPSHPLIAEPALGQAQLAAARQVVIAGRETGVADTRVLFARHLWHTDSPEAACSLLEAGLGWGWLPLGIVQWRLDAGRLRLLPLQGLANAQPLCVDLVWSNEYPRGLAARQLVAQMQGLASSSAA